MASAVRMTIDDDRICTLVLDLPEKSVNTLSVQMWADLSDAIASVETAADSRGVIIASGKPRTFIAGADLFEMKQMDRPRLEQYLLDGQKILDRLGKLPIPTVAAINGDTLGGGLEVALACSVRIAIDDPSIKIGLPETTLGLVPGWGGTVRLPRLIGLGKALPLMLQGKTVTPTIAHSLGLVDHLASREQLLEVARKLIVEPRPRKATSDTIITGPKLDEAVVRNQILQAGAADVRSRSRDHLPAPLRLIEVVRASYDQGLQAGFDAERKALCDLRESEAGKSLMRLFFLRTGAKKAAAEKAGGKPRDVKSAAVLGGGTMGAGIVHALSRAGIPVRLIEVDEPLATKALTRVKKMIDDDLAGNRIDANAASKAHGCVSASHEWAGLESVDLVIEAVLEQLPVKQDVFKRLSAIVRSDCILATNTSSLSVTDIASAATNPNRVVGLHFFNPVPRMPLVEVVKTDKTDPTTLATAVAVAGKLGKTAILVSDAPGFLINRVLFPYLAEAMRMAAEGIPVIAIDEAMEAWGMPMGPFTLMDEIGLDVTAMILRAMSPRLGDRLACPQALSDAVAKGLLGRKSGRGFYIHAKEKGVEPQVNHELAKALSGNTGVSPVTVSEEQIQGRLMKAMVDESQMCLKEGVVDSTDAIDLATVTGLGFPQFRGGLATFGKL